MGDCRHCGNKAGLFRSVHRECREAHDAGWSQMVEAAARAAASRGFSQTQLRLDLLAIAQRSYFDGDGINAAIAEGWHRAVRESLADGILTQDEEARLREFRERFSVAAPAEADATLDQAARDRVMLDARLTALAVGGWQAALDDLKASLAELALSPGDERRLLAQAWEAAVEGSLEDGVLSLDEEAALLRYLDHFGLRVSDVDANGAHRNMVKSAVIRELAEGIVPDRLGGNVQHPFNLMKSEKLVWLFGGVDYIETKTRRERRGTSHGVSIRVARGLYYRPSTFRSRVHEWEEDVHEDTGLLGVTTKHLYFHGSKKRFRVRLDKIVSFEPYSDGLGIMRDAQTAKPQTFAVGDGWFIYNLVTTCPAFRNYLKTLRRRQTVIPAKAGIQCH